MPDNGGDCCENCKFFFKAPLVAKIGECRRNPPILVGTSPQGPVCGWPMTQVHLWCGEHRRTLVMQ